MVCTSSHHHIIAMLVITCWIVLTLFFANRNETKGSEVIDALASVCEEIYTRSDLTHVGQVLLDEGLFEPISSLQEKFIDEYEFYSFVVLVASSFPFISFR